MFYAPITVMPNSPSLVVGGDFELNNALFKSPIIPPSTNLGGWGTTVIAALIDIAYTANNILQKLYTRMAVHF